MAEGNHTLSGAYVTLPQLLALRFYSKGLMTHSSRVTGNRAGQKLSRMKGRGVDFAEVRLYQPGDDVRSIDWRVTARKTKPHTRVFREERERPTLILVDQTQQMFFGSRLRLKSVAAAELASRIAWQNLLAGDRVGGIVVSNDGNVILKPGQNNKHVARLLSAIASANQSLNATSQPADYLQTTMRNALLQVQRLCRHNYRIFVISDFALPVSFWRPHLHHLAQHNEVELVHVQDALDRQLPPADHYTITDGNQRTRFFTGVSAMRQQYANRYAEHEEQLSKLGAVPGMRYLRLDNADTHLDKLVWV